MFKKLQILTLFALLCVGCDFAAQRQQAENARREETIAKLKQLGQSMHGKQNNQSSPAGAANDAPQGSDDSRDHKSEPSTTPDNPDASGGSVNAPKPTE